MIPTPTRMVLIIVDGLRRDVFLRALEGGELPHVARIVGGNHGDRACHVEAVSTAPSITFTAQASLITGQHPGAHGIPGNESFDRFGRISDGRPRHFGFDVGDTLAADDAVAVFASGLASRFLRPETPTLFEIVGAHGLRSAVFYYMYARGADFWQPPNVLDIARFTKGRGVLGLEAGAYDAGMLRHVVRRLDGGERPDVLLAYFMGLDHHSHLHGTGSQPDYLRDVLDPQIGQLLDALARYGMVENTLFILASDHGQVDAVADDRHSLRLGFPFDIELIHIFNALGLDVHDKPGEDPNCDAVMGLNGGLAHVYLQNRARRWADPPDYVKDVLPVAEAFHRMNTEGRYAEELHDTLELILIRNVERDGWRANYDAYLGDERTQPLADHLAQHPELVYVDPVNRLHLAASEVSGDLLLVARGRDGYYFGAPIHGVHGGLLPGESDPVLTFALPGGQPEAVARLRATISGIVSDRCAQENGRCPSVADMVPAALAVMDIPSR
ncbi:MAG: alkaline phosphatase family protein [Anaerolineae bacterium]|nr:alkaline phosphatase family protein [Anaerolineae bacterium]